VRQDAADTPEGGGKKREEMDPNKNASRRKNVPTPLGKRERRMGKKGQVIGDAIEKNGGGNATLEGKKIYLRKGGINGSEGMKKKVGES